MAHFTASPTASDGKGRSRSRENLSISYNGQIYGTWTPVTLAYATITTTETSILSLTAATSATAASYQGYNSLPGQNVASSTGIYALQTGTYIRGSHIGTIDNKNSAMTLKFKLYLTDTLTSTATAIADTTAIAMTGINAVANINVGWDLSVQTAGPAGAASQTVNARIWYEYYETTGASSIIRVESPWLATTSLDLTKDYTFDVKATYSNTAPNTQTMTIYNSSVELVG